MTLSLPVPFEHAHKPVFSPQARAKFLDHLSVNGNVRLACKVAGVSSQTAYRARRKSHDLARLWDAALVNARAHAEELLAARALHGTEESVFYHGEEVATRIRYDSRLLLAHLARLDRLAERAEVSAALPVFDEAIEALEQGREPELLGGPDILRQDSAPCAPPCRNSQPSCSAQDPLEEAECELFSSYEDRVKVMMRARPKDAPPFAQLNSEPMYDLEMVQLEAFEEELAEWWLIRDEDELDERLAAQSGAEN